MPIRIVIADDHGPSRRCIRSVLRRRSDWLVCGEAADGFEAVELARRLRPDVILMDVSMPRMNGIEATRAISQEVPQSAVIIVSQNDPAVVQDQARSVGAAACVAKSNVTDDLIPTMQQILSGRVRDGASGTRSSPSDFVSGGGEMGERIRSLDWAATALGPIDRWPESLKTAVRICIGSRNPIVLWWGRSALLQFYNDAYISFLGSKKHPAFLGRSGSECWSEIWETMAPMFEHVFATGDATWSEDFLFVLNRNLPREEGYFTFSYSPLWDDSGAIEGIFCACYETTGRVVGDRRLRTLRDLGRTVATAKTAEEACATAATILDGNRADVPFALFYLLDNEGREARLVAMTGFTGESAATPKRIDLASANASAWPLKRVLETGSAELVSDLPAHFECLPGGIWPESPENALVSPIASAGQSLPTGFLVAGLSARRIIDADYRSFLDLIAGHLSTTIANARTYEHERKRAEALAEIDRAKTLFFSNVSHEFRTPLTLMLGPLEDALSAGDALVAEQRERLTVAHRNALRLLKLVNTLLDFSRIEAGRIEACYTPTDLAAFTADLASVFRSAVERAGLRLIINCPPLSGPVYVDREMWEKVVFNLMSNAFKFTFAGEIEVALREAKGSVQLVVRDTGTGIPSEDLPHLFERFYRVKNARGRTLEGSGIGLALVQELAKLHGGSVRAEGQIDRGSTFTVTVPSGKNHLPEECIGAQRTVPSSGLGGEAFVEEALRWLPSSQSAADGIPLTSLAADGPPLGPRRDGGVRSRVLLADDNADMREYVQRLLRGRYDVFAVGDGQSALDYARRQRPDLVLTDVMMPRMDGFELLRALRDDQDLRTIPVILVSARAGEESRIEGLRAGADDYLAKPFSARELLARVDSHLSLSRVRRQAADLERHLRAEAEQARENYRKLAETLDAEVRVRTEELEQRNAEILRQSVDLRELSGRLLHSQDEERRHIARELHDSAGQTLAALGMTLAPLARQAATDQPEFRQSFQEADELVRQLTKEIRTMSYLLHPPLLDETGLPAALSWYVSGLTARGGIKICFKISKDFGRLSREMELVIFRIVQECLTNIHRHSGSETAEIRISRERKRVLVEVRDHGRGIPAEKLSRIQTSGSGVGIRGMRERLRQFGGEMVIDSNGDGTTVVVTIPAPQEDRKPAQSKARSKAAAP